MAMRAGGIAGASGFCDLLPFFNMLTGGNEPFGIMRIERVNRRAGGCCFIVFYNNISAVASVITVIIIQIRGNNNRALFGGNNL